MPLRRPSSATRADDLFHQIYCRDAVARAPARTAALGRRFAGESRLRRGEGGGGRRRRWPCSIARGAMPVAARNGKPSASPRARARPASNAGRCRVVEDERFVVDGELRVETLR
jgi:hypothetical protein